jgi:hypothetical protein
LSAIAARRADVEELCTRLRDRVIDNGFKPPTVTERWRTEARLLLDRDERPLAEALRLIDWATNDEFWLANIRAMGKFRAQYDTLLTRAQQEHQRRHASSNGRPTADDRHRAIQELKTGSDPPPPHARTGGPP